MLRPITRRWGICFHSTQRYTVCGLTPKYTAASRTLSGSSSRANDALTRGGVWEFGIATSSEWRLRQLFEQFTADAIEPIFFHDVKSGSTLIASSNVSFRSRICRMSEPYKSGDL
jgi:hypothetical protein